MQRRTTTIVPEVGPGAPTSKADHAYAVIRQNIVRGDFEPGERLIIEQIARGIDTSVVPVREAIRRLEAEGYVVYTRNVGATVASIDLERYPETVETVAVLEGAAIGLAAAHISARDIRQARSLNAKLRRNLKAFDPLQFSETNQRFHETLYRRCPNRHILDLLVKEWELLQRTRRSVFSFIPERAISSVEEHERLLQLIEARRPPEEIEAFARGHRRVTAKALLTHIGNELVGDAPEASR